MTWSREWDAIEGRIEGIIAAAEFFIRAQAINSDDPYAVGRGMLMPGAQQVFEEIEAFAGRAAGAPDSVLEILRRFVNTNRTLFTDSGISPQGGIKARITGLAALAAEVRYHLRDHQAVARSLTERAFLHLQRSVTADPQIRERWKEAFAVGERRCESLGAVHLLQHGIWGFKVSEAGEQTDLVLDEPLESSTPIDRVAEGLVLTEWKKISDPSSAERIAEAAVRQAERYAVGVLGSVELRRERFIVLISEKHIAGLTETRVVGDRTYLIRNIAVDPDTPSRA